MKKIIIAVLVAGLFGSFAFAQTSENDPITSQILEDLNSSVVPVRNDSAIAVDSTDINLGELEVGTSDTLSRTVSEIIKNSNNFSSFDWCRDASSFVGGLPQNAKQSLAWNKNSFSKNVETLPEDESLVESYKNAQTAYADLNASFDDMTAGLLADQAAGRFIAVARSASIEALVEFKSGNPSQDRLNGLAEISKKSIECASPENSDIVVEKLSALFGTSFAKAETTEKTEAYVTTKVTRADVGEETIATEVSTVVDAPTFKAYVAGLMSLNTKIVSVEEKESSVVIKYEVPSKFLGFIKGKSKAKIVVNNDLSVKVSYPFFNFLSSKSFKINAEEVSMALKEEFEMTEATEVSVLEGDFGAKAKVFGSTVSYLSVMEEVAIEASDAPEGEDEGLTEDDESEEVSVRNDAVLQADEVVEVETQ